MTTLSSTVLLVEDHPEVRELLELVLARAGYRCRAACDARTARQLLDRDVCEVAVIDVSLPGESGVSLAHDAAMLWGVPVVLITGTIDHETELEHVPWPILRKPFKIEPFLGAVRGALGGPRWKQPHLESECVVNG